MAADQGTLRVDPRVMAGFAECLSGAAEYLQNRLRELDIEVGELLGGWRGPAGSAYSSAWEQWHRGAGEVQAGLSILAKGLCQTGVQYGSNESASARALGCVEDG